MNDKNKIVIGLIIFLAIITSPFWYNMGKATSAPEPKLSDKAKAAKVCVEPKEYMKAEHMQILDVWRNEVVRKGNRIYKSSTFNHKGDSDNNSSYQHHSDTINCKTYR